jgi:rhodanese-related sulfurtransferase
LFGVLGRLGIRQISPKELDQKKGMMILDISTDKEYERGHIPGSVHVPLSDIGTKIKKIKKDKEMVVYCQNGNRSIWAIKRLMGMGYKNLTNLKGGYNAWKKIH